LDVHPFSLSYVIVRMCDGHTQYDLQQSELTPRLFKNPLAPTSINQTTLYALQRC